MENKRKYLANQEWSKDIKFNNHWYHLQALFDKDQEDDFDFNIAKKDNQEEIKDGGDNIFDFNKALELDIETKGTSISDNIDILYNDEQYINEWGYTKTLSNDTLSYDENKNAVISMVFSAINKLVNNKEKTNIIFEACYKIPGEKELISGIKINKNIIEHSIEDLIYNRVNYEASLNGMQVYRNYKNEMSANKYNGICELKIEYKNNIYFFEIKSGEHTTKDNKLDNSNMYIHKDQWNKKENMIFVLCDYSIETLNKNIVDINYIQLVDGNDLIEDKNKNELVNESNDNELILEQYGLSNLFKSLNESENNTGLSDQQIKDIQNKTAQAINTIQKTDKGFAQKLVDKAKQAYKKYGKRAFLSACILLNLVSGSPSITLANSLSRLNSDANRPQIEAMCNDIVGGGVQYDREIVNKFIQNNFSNVDINAQSKIQKAIMQDVSNPEKGCFRIILMSQHYQTLKEAIDELTKSSSDNIKLVKTYKNKDNANKLGKYQALGIYDAKIV